MIGCCITTTKNSIVVNQYLDTVTKANNSAFVEEDKYKVRMIYFIRYRKKQDLF